MDISVENFVWILGIKEFNGNTMILSTDSKGGGGGGSYKLLLH